MNMAALEPLVESSLWLLAIVGGILGLTILAINARHPVSRRLALLMLVFAANSLATGLLVSADFILEARFPTALIAAATPLSQVALLTASVFLFLRQRIREYDGFIRRLLNLLLAIPVLLVISDVFLGTNFWYTGLSHEYAGGYLPLDSFTHGRASGFIWYLYLSLLPAANVVLLGYTAFFDKSLEGETRSLVRLVLAASVTGAVLQMVLTLLEVGALSVLLSSGVYIAAYAAAGFRQNAIEQRKQQRTLQVRLTLLVLAGSLPLIAGISFFITVKASEQIKLGSYSALASSNASLNAAVSQWLEENGRALQELAKREAITRMEPERQLSEINNFAQFYPHMHLVATTDLLGMSLARSDGAGSENYSDTYWYQQAAAGAPLTYQLVGEGQNREPALVVATPIRSSTGDVIGAIMFESTLETVSARVNAGRISESGIGYVVDRQNKVVVHPNPFFTAELRDMSAEQSVRELRSGKDGLINFTDAQGTERSAHVSLMNNGWGVITDIPVAELLAPAARVRWMAVKAIALSGFILLVFAIGTFHQSIRPLRSLIDAVDAFAAGDLQQRAVVESEDEMGALVGAFNTMAGNVGEWIAGLERHTADRSRELEARANQLEATAEIARDAALMQDIQETLEHSVQMISSRFGFYHAGIFLLDETGKHAVLRAASSQGGKRMLARSHRLEVGRQGIVGHVAAAGEPRIAFDVGADAVFFDNPELPHTRSELSLPLIARSKVIGVLDVQSQEEAAFGEQDVTALKILADQVALAIENARLLSESRQALEKLEHMYRLRVREGWEGELEAQDYSFSLTPEGVFPAIEKESTSGDNDGNLIEVEITLRGESLGVVNLVRPEGDNTWTKSEEDLLREAANQVALALENARLLEEIRRQAEQEHIVSQVASLAQSSLDLESVMKNSTQEIGRRLGAERVRIRMTPLARETTTPLPNGSRTNGGEG